MIKLDIEQIQKELGVSTAIEQKLLSSHEYLTTDEVEFLKGKAESGSLRWEQDYEL